MAKVPADLRYTREHEWTRAEGDRVRVGITDHAQEKLGDVVFVALPSPGAKLRAGAPFGEVESVKAVSELFAPLSGEVVEVNEALGGSPELVNQDPYGRGWMILLAPEDPRELDSLLGPDEYERLSAE
ncbi:MAG: glycine cleavage system protein GcvH [Deltaproteobacteria bacterium]|nr:glycine cleavage system protein GcvH [Deltaproteobacteria bacterium]